MGALKAMIDWLLRNRKTGRVTVAQRPNLSLGVFLVAAVVRWIASPHGEFRTTLDVISRVALIWWAGDEILRGVNPFRRMLGAVVLAAALANYLR